MEIGIPVRRLKVFHKHDPRHFLYLKNLLPKFDLLHIHMWNPASCRYALAASRLSRVVITEHDPFPLSGFKGWLKNKLMKSVKAIIVCSQAAKNLVCSQDPRCGEKITVVPNGIDIEEFRAQAKSEERIEVRRGMVKNELNRKIILCTAELHERKGQKYLIEAVKRLMEKFPIQLVFVGDGVKRKYYEKLARPFGNHVAFLGRRRDIGSLMAASDIFVLPSIREAFGLVLLEAASVGLPIIATNAGGIPEIIEHGKTGMLVAPGNPKELATAIATYLEKPSAAAEFAKRAKEKVEMEFHAKTMAMRTAEVYDKILL
jgi:glycosyltransferase involved in cell wall biosynthesis